MSPSVTSLSKRRDQKKASYARNVVQERLKSRERAQRRRTEDVPGDIVELRKQRHRDAQARYREANRTALRVQSWQYRRTKKIKAARDKDELEYQAFMASE